MYQAFVKFIIYWIRKNSYKNVFEFSISIAIQRNRFLRHLHIPNPPSQAPRYVFYQLNDYFISWLIIQASSMSNWCKFDSLLLIWEFGFILGGFSFKRKDVKVVIGKGVRCSAQPSPPPAWPGTALVDPGTKNWNGPKPISIVGSTGSIGTQVNFIKHLAGVEKMHIIWWFLALICIVL